MLARLQGVTPPSNCDDVNGPPRPNPLAPRLHAINHTPKHERRHRRPRRPQVLSKLTNLEVLQLDKREEENDYDGMTIRVGIDNVHRRGLEKALESCESTAS